MRFVLGTDMDTDERLLREVLAYYDSIVERLEDHPDGPESDFVMTRDDYKIMRAVIIQPTVPEDINWLHRFLNCSVFSPPPSEIQRAHAIVDALCLRPFSIESKESAAGQDTGKPQISPLGTVPVSDPAPPAPTVPEDDDPTVIGVLDAVPPPTLGNALEAIADTLAMDATEEAMHSAMLLRQTARTITGLRSLLAQREEEITNLQAEAFDWRMRYEGAERDFKAAHEAAERGRE